MADNQRRAFTTAERAAVLGISGGRCAICRRELADAEASIDHRLALKNGGTNSLDNLQAVHLICNLTKSAKERPSWQEPDRPTATRRLGNNIYESAFGFVEYARAVKSQNGNPFVPITAAPDQGRFIERMTSDQSAELLHNGAYLVDRRGLAVDEGSQATFFFWPHVAMRDRRYNGGLDSGLDRVLGARCRFTNSACRTPARQVEILSRAAELWLQEALGFLDP